MFLPHPKRARALRRTSTALISTASNFGGPILWRSPACYETTRGQRLLSEAASSPRPTTTATTRTQLPMDGAKRYPHQTRRAAIARSSCVARITRSTRRATPTTPGFTRPRREVRQFSSSRMWSAQWKSGLRLLLVTMGDPATSIPLRLLSSRICGDMRAVVDFGSRASSYEADGLQTSPSVSRRMRSAPEHM